MTAQEQIAAGVDNSAVAVALVETSIHAIENMEALNRDKDLFQPLSSIRQTLEHAVKIITEGMIVTENAGLALKREAVQ